MKIIILGYTGVIGTSILKRLAKDSSLSIICVGRTNRNFLTKNKKIKFYKWDYNSFENSKLFFLKQANIVINCTGKKNDDFKNLEYINTIFIKKLIKHINKNQYKIRIIHLSSVSVYGHNLNFSTKHKTFTENAKLRGEDAYSRSKIQAEKIIKYAAYKNLNKNYSYTILRVSNVYGNRIKTNLFKFVTASFKNGYWIKCSEDIMFNFIHYEDVALATHQAITKFKTSKNKIYNVSNDFSQQQLYKNYNSLFKRNLINIDISSCILRFIYNFFPLPKKILNLFLLISSKFSYSNDRIKSELNFKPKFCFKEFLKTINE